GQIAGDGQADALEAASATLDRGVDADYFSFQIHERSAAVARIDGRVGLQEILIHVHVDVSAFGADDAGGDRAGHPQGRAHRQHPVADFHAIAVAHFQVRQRFFDVQANNGQVGLGIRLDVFGDEFSTVLKMDFDLLRAVNDVIVG